MKSVCTSNLSRNFNTQRKKPFSHEVNKTIRMDTENNYNLAKNLYNTSNIPILVYQGSHDILTSSIIKELFSKHITNLQLVAIEKCGHWTVFE